VKLTQSNSGVNDSFLIDKIETEEAPDPKVLESTGDPKKMTFSIPK
jgi:hypothetical protein